MVHADVSMCVLGMEAPVSQKPEAPIRFEWRAMTFQSIPRADVGYLDELLFDEEGRLRLVPAAELKKVPREHLIYWANKNARYGIPSVELVGLIKEIIGDRKALEIGAGFGDFGRHLGIRMTDSASQTSPEMRAYYASLGQPIIDPPPDVERIDGNAAVRKYKPKVVFASWVTQKFRPGDERKKIGSSKYGVDELALVDSVDSYIYLGNEYTHRDKRILKRPHATLKPDFLFSRAFLPEQDVIWIWT